MLLQELLKMYESKYTDDSELCDQILSYLSKAHHSLVRMSTAIEAKETITRMYDSWRASLLEGDLEEWNKSYSYYSGKYTDAFDFFMDEVFAQAGMDEKTSTIDEFMEICKKESI